MDQYAPVYRIALWDVRNDEVVRISPQAFDSSYVIEWLPDGTDVVFADADGNLHLWGVEHSTENISTQTSN
jgi:WD40 repeat protein